MKARSLRVRLLLTAAVAIFIALAAAWVVMTLLFERHIERRVEADLIRDGMQLAANLSIGPDGAPLLSREPGDRAIRRAGERCVLAGHDGARQSAFALVVGSELARLSRGACARLDDSLHRRSVRGSSCCWSSASSSRNALDRRCCCKSGFENKALREARAEFGAELALFLVLLWVILSAAAWTQVVLGLRPLASRAR